MEKNNFAFYFIFSFQNYGQNFCGGVYETPAVEPEHSRTESNRVESGLTKSNKVELQQFISVRLCDCVRLCSTVFTSKVKPKSNQSLTKNGENDRH